MRKPAFANKWSLCLVALAAACSSPTEENEAAEGNAVNAAAPEAANAIDANAAAPADGNAAANAVSAESGDTYRASGTEPFWSLTIDGQMVFDTPDGPDVTVATPAQQPTRAGYRYLTPEMTVVVNTFRRCTAASGDVHHDTVDVTVGGQQFSGCGGATVSAE